MDFKNSHLSEIKKERLDGYLNWLLDQKEKQWKLGKLKREFFLMRDLRETYKDSGVILHPINASIDIRALNEQGYLSQKTVERFKKTDPAVRWEAYKDLLKELNKRRIKTISQEFQRAAIKRWAIWYTIMTIAGIAMFIWYLFY